MQPSNMWRLFLILPLLMTAMAIRVPVNVKDTVDDKVETDIEAETESEPDEKPTYYTSDEAAVDSYLIPPDPHKPEELPPGIVAPATYLLPPAPNQQSEYYVPIETDVQTDWSPIQNRPKAQRRTPFNPIREGQGPDEVHIAFPMPSRQLEPPLQDPVFAVDEPSEVEIPVLERKHSAKITTPPVELQLPLEKVNRNFNTLNRDTPVHFQLLPAEPTLALHLTPPKLGPITKYPTKLYPKKYQNFQPMPIPIGQFVDPNYIPKAKPLKNFKPVDSFESDYYPVDDKKVYQLEQAEQKRRIQDEDILRQQQQQLDTAVAQTYASPDQPEQETSETNFRHPGRNSYPAPLRAAPPRPPAEQGPPPPGERTEFRMHGMKGPHSYQFGYDTGKGKNRQFRFEERDNEGRVRGHYGYMDRDGKMRVVNYNADPESGFHADAPEEQKS